MFKINSRQLKKTLKSLSQKLSKDIDYQEIAKDYIEAVYQYLYKKHSKKFQYRTPVPGVYQRRDLRLRSGKFLKALAKSKYYKNIGKDNVEVGFDISGMPSEMLIHIGQPSDITTITSERYMTIPLKEALRSNGTPIKKRALQWGRFPRTVVGKVSSLQNKYNLAMNGERLSDNSLIIALKKNSGYVPLYVLVKKVRIRARVNIQKALLDRLDVDLVNVLDKQLDRIISNAINA